MKRALITGISGQDGSYLAEFLLTKGYEVHGLVRAQEDLQDTCLGELADDDFEQLVFHRGDMADRSALSGVLADVQPAEIYNLASQSNVRASFDDAEHTADINGMGVARLLEVIVELDLPARFYQAGSSEMFGNSEHVPQSEETPLRPRSPYACAKVYAHWLTVNYREAFNVYASNGILFNHESERRGHAYVTRKITRSVARIARGLEQKLTLGNLEARRDWGYAPDYVEAMWLMLQQDHPDDYVIATGESHSVLEFATAAFKHVGLDPDGHIDVDTSLLRPNDTPLVIGDASKARDRLGWQPRVGFDELVQRMVDSDLRALDVQPDEAVSRRPAGD